MAYSIYIERDEPISLEQWVQAVSDTQGLKIDPSDIEGRNPFTGEVMVIKGQEGDVSIFDEKSGLWCKVITYSEGSISFKAPRDWDDKPAIPLRKAAVLVAKSLGGKVVGEEGEEYQ